MSYSELFAQALRAHIQSLRQHELGYVGLVTECEEVLVLARHWRNFQLRSLVPDALAFAVVVLFGVGATLANLWALFFFATVTGSLGAATLGGRWYDLGEALRGCSRAKHKLHDFKHRLAGVREILADLERQGW